MANIIETVRDLLLAFPEIREVVGEIRIDFADPEPTSYGLTSEGDTLLSEDVLGNQTRQHTFVLYSTFSGINDFERLQNSGALLRLTHWLSGQRDIPVAHDGKPGVMRSVRAENGMLYAVPQENAADGMQYQLQIIAEYTIETWGNAPLY